MFLKLGHHTLNIYRISRTLVKECNEIIKIFPPDERFNLTQQIRRAALSVHLNIAEGASRKSAAERKHFYTISRGSVIEIDAALDVAHDLGYLKNVKMDGVGRMVVEAFSMLSKMIQNTNKS